MSSSQKILGYVRNFGIDWTMKNRRSDLDSAYFSNSLDWEVLGKAQLRYELNYQREQKAIVKSLQKKIKKCDVRNCSAEDIARWEKIYAMAFGEYLVDLKNI